MKINELNSSIIPTLHMPLKKMMDMIDSHFPPKKHRQREVDLSKTRRRYGVQKIKLLKNKQGSKIQSLDIKIEM